MIDLATFQTVIGRLTELGFAESDIAWSEKVGPPTDPECFALEAIFVICNSGMQNKTARKIYEKVKAALVAGASSATVFGHEGKTGAIDLIWRDRVKLLTDYLAADDKLKYCQQMPWIGRITSYHLAKNFGADVAKPDVHLQRLADLHRVSCQELCAHLAGQSGYRVATVDTLLWRACAERVLDSRTGQLGPWPLVR